MGVLAVAVFEDPPEAPTERPRGGSYQLWRETLQPLVDDPGRWARVAEYEKEQMARQATRLLRIGQVIIPPGEWEFTWRGTAVYARFMRSAS